MCIYSIFCQFSEITFLLYQTSNKRKTKIVGNQKHCLERQIIKLTKKLFFPQKISAILLDSVICFDLYVSFFASEND